jgi:hypothetical protein
MKSYSTLFFLVAFILNVNAGGPKLTTLAPNGNLYVICIGVDNYRGQKDYYIGGDQINFNPLPNLGGCVSDANILNTKIIADFKKASQNDSSLKLFTYVLTGTHATKDSIKKVFDLIATQARPNDDFILFYAGITRENRDNETFLIPHLNNITDSLFENPDLIPLSTLSRWMNSIQAKNQLVISEAGNGETFSLNLIHNLFESNSLLASQNLRNRMIITTREYGLDNNNCFNKFSKGGPLAYCINNVPNILDAFNNIHRYEFELHKLELNCQFLTGFPYISVFIEKDYASFLAKKAFKTRGPGFVNTRTEAPKPSKTSNNYALVIGTNKYKGKPTWEDLQNPGNDAKAMSEVLSNKFGFKVKTLYDKPKDTIVNELIKYKQTLTENDNFIIFVAGHGHYDTNFMDCFLVFPESLSLNEDPTRKSYLAMASLKPLLDNLPSKRIFAIFDICYGAYFDIKAPDLSLSDYNKFKAQEIDTLISRKNKYISRIFIASGKGSVPDYWSTNYRHSPFADRIINNLLEEKDFTCPGRLFNVAENNVTEPVMKGFGEHSARGDMILKVKK